MDESKVQQRRRQQDEAATQQRAAILGLTYVDMREIEAQLPLVKGVVSIDEMYSGYLVPLQMGDEERPYRFAVTSQTPQTLIERLRKKYNDDGYNVDFVLISHSSFKAMMNRFDPPKQVVYDDIKIARSGDSQTLAAVSQTLNSVSSDRLLSYLIDQADQLQASDVHVENHRTGMRIRMRVDGALHVVADIDKDRYRVIMAELASRAGLSTASNEPQSGHIQQEITREGSTHVLNLRVEAVPTMYGHDVVLRLFNFDESLLHLDMLGIDKVQRRAIDDIVEHPRGMVLVVGPTGSGKSTTLYSMLNALNTTDRKLITLEDPIEYSITGTTQIPVNTTSGANFADGLRSVLRLDPDVVMVGEIRDTDTAKTAIQASVTGHLVLSTFHANSAATAFSRMIDLIGVNPIFSSAIRLLVAQRLVRRLDKNKQAYRPDESTRQWVRQVLADLPEGVEAPNLDDFELYKPVITDDNPFGYRGRMVIMEQLVVTEPIQRFLRGEVKDFHAEAVEAEAKRGGMVTLLQAGVLAALRGETTLEEVNRVV